MVSVDFIGICPFINVHASLFEVRYPYFAVKYGYVSPDVLFAAFYHHYVASFGRIVLFADFFESVQGQDMLVCPCWIDAYGAFLLNERKTGNYPPSASLVPPVSGGQSVTTAITPSLTFSPGRVPRTKGRHQKGLKSR